VQCAARRATADGAFAAASHFRFPNPYRKREPLPGSPSFCSTKLPSNSEITLTAEAVLYRDGDIDLVSAMAANARRDFIMLDGDGQPINNITEEEHGLVRCGRTRSGRRSLQRRLGRTPVRGF
jgi:hypothetical protein